VKRTVWRGFLCLLLFVPGVLVVAQASSSAPQTLRAIEQIFELTNEQARQARPIDLQAVVTYSDPEWGILFVQDRTGTMFVRVPAGSPSYPPGMRLKVQGVSTVGESGPELGRLKIAPLGTGPLPAAQAWSVEAIDSGQANSQFVATEGVLHPCDHNWFRVCFRIWDGKKMAWLFVPQQQSEASERLVGALVKVRGTVGRHMEAALGEPASQLYVYNLKMIQVESSPLSPGAPPIPIKDLQSGDADRRFAQPVHLHGTVTWGAPGRLFLQDASGALMVTLAQAESYDVGKTVDVTGFPARGEFGLELSDALVSPSAAKPVEIAPLPTTVTDLLRQQQNGRRVWLRARLIRERTEASQYVYQLEEGEQRFTAILPRSEATRAVVGMTPGALLEVIGVEVMRGRSPQWPGALLVLVDSPADMKVVGGSGWITPLRGSVLLAGLAVCVCVPLFWARQLRRKVRKQTAIIRTQLENELHLETKYRRLFERNLAAVFTWRADGTIVDCNLAFVRLLGFQTRDELVGRSYWDFEVDPERRDQLEEALRGEALSSRDASLRRSDQSTVHLLKNITPVQTAEGIVYETTAIDVTQLKRNQEELQRARDAAVYESLNDPLTGLPNRRLLTDTLASLLARAKSQGSMVALLYIDLDGFKLVNDSLGHPIGDGLLIQVATALRAWVSEGNMLGRIGGDEFVVILDRLRGRDEATQLAEELLAAISNPFWVEGHALAIGASIGVSLFPESAQTAEILIQQADSAMYTAKREGKNRVIHFTAEIGSLVQERLSLENQLRGAFARGEISMDYQPEFNVADRRLVRFEALARWTHPVLGAIPPAKFIPIAEESGMISSLGAQMMEKACAEALRWQGLLPHPIQIAVNVSSIQFRRPGFVEEVKGILERTGLRPELVQIELTESVMLNFSNEIAQTMNHLRALGITLAIDDFGTGYSSLSYLPSLPFDFLKIDGSFMRNLGIEPESASMVHTLITLAHSFGLGVIVEGVEKTEQLELIQAYGADEVQGFLTGRPTPRPIEVFLAPVAAG